jgi:hypothetical protein
MKGVCRTVFQGSAVEPFQFEIIDVLHGQLLNHYQKINGKSLCHKASGFATKC